MCSFRLRRMIYLAVSLLFVLVGCNESHITQSKSIEPIQIQQADRDTVDTLAVIRQTEQSLKQHLGEDTTPCLHEIDYSWFPDGVMPAGSL